RLDVSDTLMRWYEYEITVGPGERITNKVTAPLYPAVHGEAAPTYDYTYLLSAAQAWKEFQDLEIVIHTPLVMRECSLEGMEKSETEKTYTLHLDSLPSGELEFTLSESEEGRLLTRTENETGISWTAVVAAAAAILAAGGAAGYI